MSVELSKEQLELAEGRWEDAIREHAQPPPDAGFPRVERLSNARTGISVAAIAHAFGGPASAA